MELPKPIITKTLIKLSEVGVPKSLMKFKNVSLQKDRFICVKDEDHVTMIDVKEKKTFNLPSKVESAILNPSKNIIGLMAEKNLQVFDLSKKAKLNSAVVNAKVEFWKWINDDVIAFVTSEKVYHWSIPNNGAPHMVFEREKGEENLQIINYRTTIDLKWLVLGGIAAGENGQITGSMQLYSKIRERSQMFRNAHSGCFAQVTLDGRVEPCDLFCFFHSTDGKSSVTAFELAAELKKAFRSDAQLSLKHEGDFAVSLLADEKHSMLFTLTKWGYLFVTDIQSGTCIFSEKVRQTTPFASVQIDGQSGGVVTLGQDGVVMTHKINRDEIIDYLVNEMNEPGLAAKVAMRIGVEFDIDLFVSEFDKLLEQEKYIEAAQLAEGAPNEVLRTKETVRKFSMKSPKPNQAAPVLQYFSYLLKKGALKDFESIELVKPILNSSTATGKKHIEDWIREEKLAPTEELGDLLMPHDTKLACSVYLRASCVAKAIDCFLELGHHAKIFAYAEKENFEPDYTRLLRKLWMSNRERSKEFAQSLVEKGLLDVREGVEIFMSEDDFKTTTSFLLDVFKTLGDRAEDADLQTLLLSVNLSYAPQVAEAIMDSDDYVFSHYDRQKIAEMCESADLFEKALENFENLEDIKRCLRRGIKEEKLKNEFVLNLFGEMSPEEGLECIADLLEADYAGNVLLAVDIAKRYSEQMTQAALVALFEKYRPERAEPGGATTHDALFLFLKAIVDETQEEDLVHKFIGAAAEAEQFAELRRVCQTNTVFDPEEVKNLLLERSLEDPRPLIVVCNRFGFVDELTRYLYERDMMPFIDAYVKKMNCKAAPSVVSELIDLNAPDEQILALLEGIRPEALGESFKELIEETSVRGRLSLLLPWMENLSSSGCTEPLLFNALAMVYVEQNHDPEEFLQSNELYDFETVGAYCEERDLKLAFLVYRKAAEKKKNAVEKLIRVVNEGGFYAEMAQLLVKQQDETLWVKSLCEEGEHRRALIAQIVTVLGESRQREEVSAAVKAFVAAELPSELIKLLEQLVLTSAPDRDFHNSKHLQNLLILTAIKSDPKRVMNYITKLSNYDGPDIAKIALSDQYQLFEEAFTIYNKFGKSDEALSVLLDHICDFERAREFAESSGEQRLWGLVGKAQLKQGLVAEAVQSFIRGESTKEYLAVIKAAKKTSDCNKELVSYLEMVRKTVKDSVVENELLYLYAKEDQLEEFNFVLKTQNAVKLEPLGVRLMKEHMHEAARMVYETTRNYCHLALCCVNLGLFSEAVEAAKMANNTATWKVVCYACVDAGEFSLAQVCAEHIVAHADQLCELVSHYEASGCFDQLIEALEAATQRERAHSALFTTLGVLYCKFQPQKMMGHLLACAKRANVKKLLSAALEYHMWPEAALLLQLNGQHEKAVELIIDHSPYCFDHQKMLEMVPRIATVDVLYRIMDFYVEQHPLLLSEVLSKMSKLDNARLISSLKKKNLLPLALDYLLSVQSENELVVNETINELYIEEENLEGLKSSTEKHSNFDAAKLAKTLETHSLKKFRSLAASMYRKNNNFEKALGLLREDGAFEEMIDAVVDSRSQESAEALVRFFVGAKKPFFFALALLRCRSLVRTHVVLEIAWKNGWSGLVMPFAVQAVANFETRLEKLEKINEERERKQREKLSAKTKKNKDEMVLSRSMLAIMPEKKLRSGKSRDSIFD